MTNKKSIGLCPTPTQTMFSIQHNSGFVSFQYPNQGLLQDPGFPYLILQPGSICQTCFRHQFLYCLSSPLSSHNSQNTRKPPQSLQRCCPVQRRFAITSACSCGLVRSLSHSLFLTGIYGIYIPSVYLSIHPSYLSYLVYKMSF